MLQFNQFELAKVTSGYIVNLVSSDVHLVDVSVEQSLLFFASLFELVAVIVLSWVMVGVRALAGMLFMIFLGVSYICMSTVTSELRYEIAKMADKRISIMNGVVVGIRTVKMHAWEGVFMERVQKLRRYYFHLERKAGEASTLQ